MVGVRSRSINTIKTLSPLQMMVWVVAALLIAISGSGQAKIVIEWWDDHTLEQLEAFQQVIEMFEGQYPDIEVRLSLVDPSVYYDRLAISFVSGVGPDVFYLHDFQAAPWHSRGYTTDLEPFIEQSGYDVSDLWPAQIPLMSLDGKLHGLPYDWSLVGLYYNENIFDAHGVAYPDESWSWDDLAQAGRQFRTIDASGHQIGWAYLPFPINWGGWNVFGELKSFGAYLFTEDGLASAINSSEAEEYLRFMQDLRLTGVTPHRYEYEGLSDYQMFTQERVAMASSGSWAMLSYKEGSNFDWDVSYQPKGPHGRWVTATGGHYAISEASEQKDAAWTFLSFLASPDAQRVMNVDHLRSLPGLRSVASDWVDAAYYGEGPKGAQVFVNMAQDFSIGLPPVTFWNAVAPSVISNFGQVFEGQMSPGEAIVHIERDIETAISRAHR